MTPFSKPDACRPLADPDGPAAERYRHYIAFLDHNHRALRILAELELLNRGVGLATLASVNRRAAERAEEVARGHALISLVLVLLATMALTSFMSNAATAAVMCPVAVSTASNLAAGADPFLMAVAVASSCAFLTPISHQNNTLILGPGGFRFGDYWRLRLPLEAIVVAVGVPMILVVWPL